VDVALVGRPGIDLSVVADALSPLSQDPGVRLTGVEIGWSAQWEQAVDLLADLERRSALSVEVPPGAGQERALSELQRHAAGPGLVQAKFRTGATPDTPAPTLTELASFIRAAVDHDLGFKLTGGLHHAISQTTEEGQNQVGFLNVIAATRWALAHGAEVPEMETLLSQRDPVEILDIITRMSGADASVLRAFFTAYGCCGVMDPIGDLASLGLIKETTV
jgi:predicted TIM-barrel fold metal-dependent hydrolase